MDESPDDDLTEAQLCEEFRGWWKERGWIVHPEVALWDMVAIPGPAYNVEQGCLVTPGQRSLNIAGAPRNEDGWQPGDQFGIQAKLVSNMRVLWQTIQDPLRGPAFRCVLVRRATEDFRGIAERLGLLVVAREVPKSYFGRIRGWERAIGGFRFYGSPRRFNVMSQLELPPLVMDDLPAGTPCPKQLTPWRVKALRLCRVLRARGYVVALDFKTIGIDPKRWIENSWLTDTGETCIVDGHKRPQRKLVATPGVELPDVGWEEVSKALEAKETAA
jgi:hypothetical protein